MVNTKKFSQFATAPLTNANNEVVGLEGGLNVQSVRFLSWTTAGRPASPFNGLLGINTTLQQYEFWDASLSQWTQLEDSGDINNVFARLASHAAGEGASLIGLQDQSNVTSKTVQDLANATFIAQTSNGTLQNAQYLGSLTTGIVKNTTVTGVLSISAPLTSIDGLTTVANNMLYTTAPNVYAVIAPANSSALISSAGGVPSWSQTLPTTVQSNITQLGAQSQALNMNTHLINSVVDPVSAQDAATKNYVDTLVANFAVVFAARLGSTTALTVTYNNGSFGVGATLTNAGAMAALSLDGTAVALNDLVLIKNQASTLQNGYYVVTNIGSGATNWVLTRSTAYDQPSEINPGDIFVITSGATLAQTSWMETSVVTAVGTDPITFSQFSVALPISVPNGGTGVTSFTAYAVICGGTTATSPLQSIASVGTSGEVLTSNGAGMLPTFQPIPAGDFNSINIQVITATGTYTPTANTSFVIVEILGGGGGGGGCASAGAGTCGSGGSGAGGGYSRKFYDAAGIGADAAVTIGAGGAGGSAGANAGTTGGTTTFNPAGTGVTISATGGVGGGAVTATAGAVLGRSSSSVGSPGVGSNGDVNIQGGHSGYDVTLAAGVYTTSGHGGGNYFAPFGAANTGATGNSTQNGQNADANSYGCGGSAGSVAGTGVDASGGNGMDGIVIVTEYII